MSRMSEERFGYLKVQRGRITRPFNTLETELFDEIEALRAELAEYLEEAFCQMAAFTKGDDTEHGGWWDTCAISTTRDIGDRLGEMGLYERHPDGSGRRQWYRPLRETPLLDEKDSSDSQ